MNNENDIVQKYSCLLEDTSFMQFGRSERLLPAPKSDIDAVLTIFALSCQKAGDENGMQAAMNGYMELATFIPHEKFCIVKKFYNPKGLEMLADKDIEKDEFLKIQNEIVGEMGQRKKRINEVLEKVMSP